MIPQAITLGCELAAELRTLLVDKIAQIGCKVNTTHEVTEIPLAGAQAPSAAVMIRQAPIPGIFPA
jgi:hypothetical protein